MFQEGDVPNVEYVVGKVRSKPWACLRENFHTKAAFW